MDDDVDARFEGLDGLDMSRKDTFEAVGGLTEEDVKLEKEEAAAAGRAVPVSRASQPRVESFAGKRFETAGFVRDQVDYELLDAATVKFETPVQRLQRLEGDLAALRADLDTLSTDVAATAAVTGEGGKGFTRDLRHMQALLETFLRERKDAQRAGPVPTLGNPAVVPRKLGDKVVAELRAQHHADDTAATDGIEYEIYTNATELDGARSLDEEVVAVERHLRELEELVGELPPDALGAEPLRARVAELNRIVSHVDDSKLKSIKHKVSLITPHMDAVLKQRETLPAVGKGSVDDLLTTLDRWTSYGAYLPMLLERLQLLAELRSESGGFEEEVAVASREQGKLSRKLEALRVLLRRTQMALGESVDDVLVQVDGAEQLFNKVSKKMVVVNKVAAAAK